tara:strand:- start:7991 stop:8689 length:699 start_codon:yes stop_codon:yes gene_type:complete
MKTAILISGIGRSIEYTFENLKSNLIDCWEDRDVYVFLGKSDVSEKARELFSTLDRCEVLVKEEEKMDEEGIVLHPSLFGPGHFCTPQSTLKMYKARSLVCDMMNNSGKKYDRVILSREDVIYSEPVNLSIESLDMSKMWLPDWHHWLNGYHDRFVVTNQDYISTYVKMTNHLREYQKEKGYVHSETTLRQHLDRNIGTKNIKTFFIEFHRIRKNGEVLSEGMPNPQERRYM